MKRRRDWIIAISLGCLVILLTSSLRTNWCHLIPSRFVSDIAIFVLKRDVKLQLTSKQEREVTVPLHLLLDASDSNSTQQNLHGRGEVTK